VPTIALNTESVENIRFANYQLLILDFAGEDQYERIRDFTVIDMFFLLTDSTLRNIISSKKLYEQIHRDCPHIPIVVIANKQDLPDALDPSAISKVMGVEAPPMVAVDLAYRDDLLQFIVDTLTSYFDLDISGTPPVELLTIS
jgi:signal recognition particle receptor subunit beta